MAKSAKELLLESETAKIRGKVSNRVCLLVARGYLYGSLDKPLEQITDKEFLSGNRIGPKTLAEIRAVIPSPK